MAPDDPFERAARREHLEEVRREALRSRLMSGALDYGARGAGGMFAFFFLPYVVWALLRASNHRWGEPSIAKSLTRFFFGSGAGFAALTVWLLFILWIWMVQRSKS